MTARHSLAFEKLQHKQKNFRYHQQTTDTIIANKGGPRLDWIKANKLNCNSTPQDWFAAFLPEKRKQGDEMKFSMENWCQCSNQKAQQANAGTECYKDFVPFSPTDIQMQLGLYILNGINPSQQVEMKLKS